MTALERVLKAYKDQEFDKFKSLSGDVQSLDDLAGLSLPKLYPEFKIGPSELVGVFDPFATGEFGALGTLGQGSSVLTLLPFYEKVIVSVARVSAEYFEECYGVAVPDFFELVQAGRVLPLLPISGDVHMFFGSGHLEYLAPLYAKHWPSSDRTFRLSQNVAVHTVAADDFGAKAIASFTEIMVGAVRDIFGDASAGASVSFVKLCNRAIYRGDVLLVLTWIDLAKQYKRLFLTEFPDGWAELTLSILDFRDHLFQMNLIAPGGSASYSNVAFSWLAA